MFVFLTQDVQHREAMGLLRTADRSSLISEIHQLRGQLEQLHHGEPVECSLKEQKEGGGADGVREGDRLLVEELKGELSQTKLELETTLKAQHKHFKELDTLRFDVMAAYRYINTPQWTLGCAKKHFIQLRKHSFIIVMLLSLSTGQRSRRRLLR